MRHRRESEEVDLVLGDENTFDLRVNPGKALGIEGDVLFEISGQQRQPAVPEAETNALRLVAEAVAPGELARSGDKARSSSSPRTPRCASMNLLCTPGISTYRR